MARKLLCGAFLFIVVSAVSGCMGGARFVHKDVAGGTVAIPENTDMWPTYYRSEAIKMIREQHGANVEIVSEGEVVVGQETRNDQRTENRKIGPDGTPIGNLTTSVNTTSTTDKKEYQIQYRIKPMTVNTGGMVPANGGSGLIPAGGINKPLPTGGTVGGVNYSTEIPPTGKPLINVDQKPVNVDPRTGTPISPVNNYGTGLR
jgi:hypothetical protein